ncbi:MAG: 6-phosphogluconolactonase [Acidobacteria bacterium]|nr:6-phosphogluconolactonase [Acidobacteriota bacterium]
MRPSLRILSNLESLNSAIAENMAESIRAGIEARGRFSIALAGGQTPRALYMHLAAQFARNLPWSKVHLFWGDERYVPHDDVRSNYRLARETLLDRIDLPAQNVYAIPTHFADPDEAARSYETTLKDFFSPDPPRFDLILLGMGPDGHTASLFPGTPAVDEQARWVVAVRAPAEPPVRITLTVPAIRQAGAVYFLISGKDKAEMLRNVLTGDGAPTKYPAAVVLRSAPNAVCWTDEAAASLVRG